jgi:hypothetical protein
MRVILTLVNRLYRKVLLSLRSRRKHKAWGASPRFIEPNDFAARETGGSLKVSGCRPLPRAPSLNLIGTWGLRPRLYAATCFAGSASNSCYRLRIRLLHRLSGIRAKPVQQCFLLCATEVVALLHRTAC